MPVAGAGAVGVRLSQLRLQPLRMITETRKRTMIPATPLLRKLRSHRKLPHEIVRECGKPELPAGPANPY
jgi:hypothetical protein